MKVPHDHASMTIIQQYLASIGVIISVNSAGQGGKASSKQQYQQEQQELFGEQVLDEVEAMKQSTRQQSRLSGGKRKALKVEAGALRDV